MILQPISSKLPNFLNKLIPENQEKDQRRWWEILSGLQENLRYVANYLFKASRYLRFEQESSTFFKDKYVSTYIGIVDIVIWD